VSTPSFLHPFSKPAQGAETFIEIVSGNGAVVVDAKGNEYIDALASLWYCQVGHGRNEIVDAITAQARKLATFHTFDRFTNTPANTLCDQLSEMAPFPDARVFLTSGGSEAVESSLKISRFAHYVGGEPDRTLVISRAPSYHGVTFGSLAVTGLPLNQTGYGPLLGDVVNVPYDDLAAVDAVIDAHGPGRLAAIIAEPVVGAGGVLPPPDGYLDGLRARCDAAGAFLIFDEVICGFGRLGEWFGAQRYGVRPDLITFAKGVTSGYQPVGGVLIGAAVRAKLEASPDTLLRHGHTYSGHPTACAAALANLEVIQSEGLLDRAVPIGKRLADGLRTLVGSQVLDVRGDGAMWAAVLAEGVDAIAVRDRMLERGVIARPIGAGVMAFCPPLVITDDQIDRCVEAFSASL
jgi:adenosylmethionine-8-amino-7-oxononanoate aminotransferase